MSADGRIFIQTFCGFDVFIANRAAYFSSKKSKELLALLISRRGCSMPLSEITHTLHSNTPEGTAKNNIRVARYGLRQILREYGCEELLIHRSGVYSVNVGLFTCDYYESMRENRTYIAAHTGEYISEYWWASGVVPYLDMVYELYNKKHSLQERLI